MPHVPDLQAVSGGQFAFAEPTGGRASAMDADASGGEEEEEEVASGAKCKWLVGAALRPAQSADDVVSWKQSITYGPSYEVIVSVCDCVCNVVLSCRMMLLALLHLLLWQR